MKTKLFRIMAFTIIVLAGTIVLSCTQTNNNNATPKTTPCTTNGTTVNIGGSNGSTYEAIVGYNLTRCMSCPCNVTQSSPFNEEIVFDNTNLNLSLNGPGSNSGSGCNNALMQVGGQTCLDFTYSGTPTALTVALGDGAGYVGQFSDGHVVKFIVNSYHNGVANITYTFQ